jgi:hypothetical protein
MIAWQRIRGHPSATGILIEIVTRIDRAIQRGGIESREFLCETRGSDEGKYGEAHIP